MDVLHSKIQIPKRYNILHRNRLHRHFDDICQKKLVAVTAGAGYGKTTLVMDALSRHNIVPVWYRLDEQDNDFFVFISYLYSAVMQNLPDTNMPVHETLKSSLKNLTDVLHEWLNFLEKKVTQQTVIVFDDYHLVQESQQINDAIEFILNRLPDNIHLIIIGRKNLPLRLSIFRAKEQLIEINENDLSFTISEIKRFFTAAPFLKDSDIKEIQAGTGGWAASLVLLRYALKKKTPEMISGSLKLFEQTPEYIFSYLKETIFDTQPAHIKEFMMKAALLPEIDTKLCNKIFGMNSNTQSTLRQMIEDHLMIFPVDDSGNVFYLHHLFQDFLIAQLEKNFSKSDIDELHCKIAKEIKENDVFQALHHFIEGHAFDKAIGLIEVNGMKFLLEGKINFLNQCLKKIPDYIIENNPQILLAQAKLYSHFGNPRQAMEYIKKAHMLFSKQGLKEEMVTCLIELGTQYYFTGYVKEAKLLMEQVLDDVEKPSETYIIAMSFLIFLPSVLGEFDTAKFYYKSVWDVIGELPDFERKASTALMNTSLSHTLYFQGKFEQSQEVSQKLLKSVHELNLAPCLPLVYYQLSANSFFLGTYEKGVEFGQKGIEICEKISLSDSIKGWVYLALAQNCLALGKLEKAIVLIDQSIEFFEDPGNRWGMANAWDCLHHVYLAMKKIKPAGQMINRALDVVKGYGLLVTEGVLENSKAGVFIIENEFPKALHHLKNARKKLDGANFYLFNNHLLTTRAYFELNNTSKACKHLASALVISENNFYDRFLKKEVEWLIHHLKGSLLKKIIRKKKSRIYLKNIFKDELAKKPVDLNILLFGQCKITVGKTYIPLSKWKSSKALMILKYLAANRRKGFIPREVIIEMLWPDEDLQKTGSRFNMAMSALRKTLEPNLVPKAPSAFIERKKDMYRLSMDVRIKIDSEQFSVAFSQAEKEKNNISKRLTAYLEAQSIYQEVFLEADRYEEWCIQKREQFAADYLNVLKAIVNIYEIKKEIKNAIYYAKKILKADSFDESIFKQLMTFYAASGNVSKIKKTYNEYEKMIQLMDFPASKDINSLYNNLIKKRKSAK